MRNAQWFSKCGGPGQQHLLHLGAPWKCEFSGLIPGWLNQKLWGWRLEIGFNKLSGDSVVHSSLRTTVLHQEEISLPGLVGLRL